MRELKKLRKPRPLHISATRLLPGTTTLKSKRAQGDTVEILAKFRARDAEEVRRQGSAGKGERTVIGYDTARQGVYVDRTKSGNVGFSPSFPSVEFAPLKPGEMGSLRCESWLTGPRSRSSAKTVGSPSPTRSSRS